MSSVPVKLDENLGQSHAELLRQAGYSADRVTDEGLSGALDPVVWQRVRKVVRKGVADRFTFALARAVTDF